MNKQNIYLEWLVLKAQAGETGALNELLELIRHRMLVYARRLMPGSADADDCVQDALLVVSKQLPRLREPKAFHGWMYRIINSRCQDHWRRQRPTAALFDEAAQGPDTTGETGQQLDVSQAISRLPARESSVLHLFYFEGFTVTEISQILDKPAGTVKSLLFQARGHIKTLLTQESAYEH
jgi:RNA polymerase sigma factor (sigma-70 family)